MKSKKGWKDRFSSKKSAKWFQNRVVPVGGKEFPYTQDLDEDMQVCSVINNTCINAITLYEKQISVDIFFIFLKH